MFMPVVFVVACGDVVEALQLWLASLICGLRACSLPQRQMRDRCRADRRQELRLDALKADPHRRGQADKSFVNCGIESLSNGFKRKNIDF
jgi:hypothetical protein